MLIFRAFISAKVQKSAGEFSNGLDLSRVSGPELGRGRAGLHNNSD